MKGLNCIMKKNKQTGAVSLFVVVFTALLITVITVGFISLMLRNQKQASDSDLSQSAYDSALAGVEDAKRAILRMEDVCGDPTKSTECIALKVSLSDDKCLSAVNDLEGVGVTSSGTKEVLIKTNDEDEKLDQAYTCVKVSMNNPDYLGFLGKDSSNLIPLIGEDEFNKVKISWYLPADLDSGSAAVMPPLVLPTADKNKLLPKNVDWANRPSIIRAQFIIHEPSFKLSNFDDSGADSFSKTLFLYPNDPGNSSIDLNEDTRRRKYDVDLLHTVDCKANFSKSGGYACSVTINLQTDVAVADGAYLNLATLYSKANYQITLLDSAGDVVNFKDVQPEIDSTGRANDVFRRVKSRIERSNSYASILAPFAAVDIQDDFCKTYKFYADKSPDNLCP